MTLTLPNIPRSQESFFLANQSRTGGVSIGGTQQTAVNPASYWKARIGLRMRRVSHFIDLRGFLASIDGQFAAFGAGPIDYRGQPWYVDPLFGVVNTPKVIARNGSNLFPDFVLASAVPMNGVSFSIQRNMGGPLRSGQYLQLGSRLHVIVSVDSADPPLVNGGALPGTVSVTVRPWTKQAFDAGTPVNFTNPQCQMRISDSDAPNVEMTTSPVGDLTLNLVEA